MSINRVQKLLFSEYCDFEDIVLIESPFAQTTKDGEGIRQVYLGLTPTKLVLATDVLPPVESSCTHFTTVIDPDIETFELIAIYPVECVNLTLCSKPRRQALKAHFCNNSVLHFELGGFENRKMVWNLWQERIRFLSPDDNGSSDSQTSIASSCPTSSLYILESNEVFKPNGMKQMWCKFGTGKSRSNLLGKWTDRHLYIGKSFEEFPELYVPQVKKPTLKEFVHERKLTRNKTTPSSSDITQNSSISDTSYSINRFGFGIEDNCRTTLILPSKIDETTQMRNKHCLSLHEFIEMAERCIKLWESNASKSTSFHRRKYGLSPYPHFLYGLGPWSVPTGCKYSIQVKRCVSAVTIKRQPTESELRLPISRRQLLATVSYDDLKADRFIERSLSNGLPVVLFWTPCFWYRPRTAKYAYDELHDHLSTIREWRESQTCRMKYLRKLFCGRKLGTKSETNSDMDIDSLNSRKNHHPMQQYSSLEHINSCKKKKDTHLQKLKKSLKLDLILSAWDFDSTTLAQQLTLIDKELFERITNIELGIIIWQQSSKNTPNISAITAFAHRISCLVTSEILKQDSEKVRARLITRFINVADKCHRMSNYQSCKTILYGLQSLAVYRLTRTWAYVRKKHWSSYRLFEYLCNLYRDIRLSTYQKAFSIAMQDAPYLPQIADILGKLLDRVPQYKLQPTKDVYKITKTDLYTFQPAPYTLGLRTENNNFSNLSKFIGNKIQPTVHDARNIRISNRYTRKPFTFKTLHSYLKPFQSYEDNKIRCLQETTRFLLDSQLTVAGYSFGINELARSYLLRARYKEDKENFYVSLTIEPPISDDIHFLTENENKL